MKRLLPLFLLFINFNSFLLSTPKGITDYLITMKINKKVYLVHGDLSSLDDLSHLLKGLFGNRVEFPNNGQIININ